MERNYELVEFKKQMLQYFELSRNTLDKKMVLITKELLNIKKEHETLTNKFKELLIKVEPEHENYNESFISNVQNISNNQTFKTIQIRNKTPSKINIQNLYINKKVQIGKNFSKLKLEQNSFSKPSSPLLITNHRKINRKNFSHYYNNPSNQTFTNPSSLKSNKSIIKNKKFSNEIISKTVENLRENSGKKRNRLSKSKSKEYIIDNRKLSIVDIPSIISNNLKKNLEKSKIDNFCMVLAKSNVLPIKLRLIFALKSKLYSKEEILRDYQNHLSLKKINYLDYDNQFILFKPSKSVQCFFGFINKEQENEFIQKHNKFNSNDENDVILFNMFKILYIILNKEISSNDNDLIKDFFDKIYKELKIDNLKNCFLNIISPNFTLSKVQLNTINMIFKNYPKIIDNNYFKSLQNDKIFFTICLFIKEIYEYSQKKFPNGKYMIMYLYEKNELNKK